MNDCHSYRWNGLNHSGEILVSRNQGVDKVWLVNDHPTTINHVGKKNGQTYIMLSVVEFVYSAESESESS